MGGGRAKWNRKRKCDDRRKKNIHPTGRKDYTPVVLQNAKMECYYALQQLHHHRLHHHHPTTNTNTTTILEYCETDKEKEEEYMKFMNCITQILPASFRISGDVDNDLRLGLEKELDAFVGKETEIVVEEVNGRRPVASYSSCINSSSTTTTTTTTEKNASTSAAEATTAVNSDLKEEKEQLEEKKEQLEEKEGEGSTNENVNNDSGPKTKIKRMAPAKRIPFLPSAYQLSFDRRTIRRNASLSKLHDWLKVQSDAGFLTRQETVSMIPPIVLDVQPHHAVLDMCAAPGSKTSQLLEIVANVSGSDVTEPQGFVVANDSDAKRAYMLVHQLRRINSPAVFVTSADAQVFPNIASSRHNNKLNATEGIFDRVLCDVPCTGDGTTRKNPGIWRHWNQLAALSLHPLQVSIALNGARLAKVGGYICYSTCSLNPIENEAVVAEILRSTDGALRLIDRRPDLPGILARPGWSTWHVLREDRSKSRKERKNYQKKNNAKMKQRRRQWTEQQKNQQEEKELEKDDDDGDGMQGNAVEKKSDEDLMDVDKNEAKDSETSTTNHDKKSDTINKTQEDQTHHKNDSSNDNNSNNDDNDNDNNNNNNNNDDVEDDGNDYITEFARMNQILPDRIPPSWDYETLLRRAESVGLILHKTHDDVPIEWKRRVRPSVFPPVQGEGEAMELHKCMRCLPHDMDTGGFFVALFEKVKPLSARARRRAAELAAENRPDVMVADGDVVNVKDVDDDGEKEDDVRSKVVVEEEEGDDDDDPAPEEKKLRVNNDDDDENKKLVKDGEGGNTKPSTVTDPIKTGEEKEEKAMDAVGSTPVASNSIKNHEPTTPNANNNNNNNKGNNNNTNDKVVKGKPLLRGRGKTRGDLGNENFIPVNESVWPDIINFYGFHDNDDNSNNDNKSNNDNNNNNNETTKKPFPKHQIMARACGEAKVLYFITNSIKTNLIDCGLQDRVTIINSGLRAFSRNTKDCDVHYRLNQEAIHLLAPYMNSNRKLVIGLSDFSKCLATGAIPISKFTSSSFVDQIRSLKMGSFVVALEGYEWNVGKKMFLVMWRCRGDHVNCLVAKVEMNGMRSKIRTLEQHEKGEKGNDEGKKEERMGDKTVE